MTIEEQLAAAKARIAVLEETLRIIEDHFGAPISIALVNDDNTLTTREPLLPVDRTVA